MSKNMNGIVSISAVGDGLLTQLELMLDVSRMMNRLYCIAMLSWLRCCLSFFFLSKNNRKSMKNRKYVQASEIQQRAKYLERLDG